MVLGIAFSARATHLRAGEIIVERESCSGLTFKITVTVFTNTLNTSVLFGGDDDWLDFGDGSDPILVPETQNTERPDLGEHIATASFTIRYTYSGPGAYIISYSEPNRNEGVVNMDGSVNTRFYIETKIIIDPFVGCNNSPRLLVPPIDRACTSVAWFHNPGAYDPDGDRLTYHLVVPFRAKDTEVFNYRDPNTNTPNWYTDYPHGDETGTKPPIFKIDSLEGTLEWNAPGDIGAGEYNIAFIIQEWRLLSGEWIPIGFVRRDMQIIVEDCENDRPELVVPADICIEAGTTLNEVIYATDPNGDPIKIEAFSVILSPNIESPATYEPFPPDFQDADTAKLEFQWNTVCAHVQDVPYQVVFKATDDPAQGPKLVDFKSWFIKVVGPKPIWVGATTDLANRSAILEWEPYLCQNAAFIQIWRRVGSFEFEPDSCQTGMPPNYGFELLATVPVDQTGFTDNNGGKGLAAGAEYCYRLVATFPPPRGGESYVSEEICIPPILVDEPVITKVSIEKTDTTAGEITVVWTKPFEIDRDQFPGPFSYELYRAEGLTGNTNITLVNPGTLEEDDTVFVDTGLNTLDLAYNYRVVLYSNTADFPAVFSAVDTSSVASSVRLSAKSEFKRIILSWAADVPWSNIIQTEPNEHDLYRGEPEEDQEDFDLIAEVDPTVAGLTYADEGEPGSPLVDTETYCYRVLTRGGYGNPNILEPLENFSQILCAQPSDTIPPCKPLLVVKLSDCGNAFNSTHPCDQGNFSNELSWERPTGECAFDVLGYKVYRSKSLQGEYTWLENAGIITGTSFVDNGVNGSGLNSLAYCYRLSAIDRSGNESELSDPVCNDNCPYYELPNVFTPNGDPCNSLFSAWSDRPIPGIGGETTGPPHPCTPNSDDQEQKCARFVEQVFFKVYNRWGKEVYEYESGGERTIYIDWDGRGSDGTELASGVYFYVADVTFDSVDPKKRNKTIKGWVHLIR